MPCINLRSRKRNKAQERLLSVQATSAEEISMASPNLSQFSVDDGAKMLKDGDVITLHPALRQESQSEIASGYGNNQDMGSLAAKTSSRPDKIEANREPAKSKKKHALENSRRHKKIVTPSPVPLKTRPSRADLINAESRLGSTIFGPIPEGHRREFFHDQRNIWIWHEGWYDEHGHERQLTVRYEVRPSGVYKKISAGKYIQLKDDELENFRHATRTYLQVIKRYLYQRA